jgi:uncharacterized phage protein (TIGR01671 family)
METIKFRGLAYSQGWVYGSYIHSKRFAGCGNEHRIFNQETGLESDVIPESVGQFTGLTDKNGKEIYSGDEIRFPYKDEMEENGIGYCEAVVTFEKSAFRCREIGFNYERINKTPMTLDEFIEDEQIEIIRNIFENKDLINQ